MPSTEHLADQHSLMAPVDDPGIFPYGRYEEAVRGDISAETYVLEAFQHARLRLASQRRLAGSID